MQPPGLKALGIIIWLAINWTVSFVSLLPEPASFPSQGLGSVSVTWGTQEKKQGCFTAGNPQSTTEDTCWFGDGYRIQNFYRYRVETEFCQ